MAGYPFTTPYDVEIDANGVPYDGAKMWFYQSGTNTLQNTYSDVGLTIANLNPVPADSNGRFPAIWLASINAYKVVLFDQYGNQIWTADPVGPAAGGNNTNSVGIVGEIRAFAGLPATIPSQWYLCYGQAVSRTTYSAAFLVLGTIWGPGDGSTTFNLPDLRGRGLLGVDNMGGTPANRITSGVCGISGVSLGASGGGQLAQMDTLTAVTTVNDPTHTHTIGNQSAGVDNFTGNRGTSSGGSNNASGAKLSLSNSSTGISVSTKVTSSLTGTTQNVQPSTMINWIIFLGA